MKPVLSFNIRERRCKSMSKTMPTTAHPLRSCAQIGVCKQQLSKQYTRTKRRRQFRISVVSDSNHPDLGFNFFGCAPLSLHRLKLPYRCETVRRSGVPRTPEATAATLLTRNDRAPFAASPPRRQQVAYELLAIGSAFRPAYRGTIHQRVFVNAALLLYAQELVYSYNSIEREVFIHRSEAEGQTRGAVAKIESRHARWQPSIVWGGSHPGYRNQRQFVYHLIGPSHGHKFFVSGLPAAVPA